MPVTVHIPLVLRTCAGDHAALELSGATVAEVLGALVKAHPKLKTHLFNDKGTLQKFVNVYLNDEDVRYMKQANTPVQDGDIITIVQAVAGE